MSEIQQLRRALAEALALVHALNSNHVEGRNPYSFPAVRLANKTLTGDEMDGGFPVGEVCQALGVNKAKALVFAEPVKGECETCAVSYGDGTPEDPDTCVHCGTIFPR